jgi:hypothetical protein
VIAAEEEEVEEEEEEGEENQSVWRILNCNLVSVKGAV